VREEAIDISPGDFAYRFRFEKKLLIDLPLSPNMVWITLNVSCLSFVFCPLSVTPHLLSAGDG